MNKAKKDVPNSKIDNELVKLFQLAKKCHFYTQFLSFFSSVALLCNSKKPSNGNKIANFRYNSKKFKQVQYICSEFWFYSILIEWIKRESSEKIDDFRLTIRELRILISEIKNRFSSFLSCSRNCKFMLN